MKAAVVKRPGVLEVTEVTDVETNEYQALARSVEKATPLERPQGGHSS